MIGVILRVAGGPHPEGGGLMVRLGFGSPGPRPQNRSTPGGRGIAPLTGLSPAGQFPGRCHCPFKIGAPAPPPRAELQGTLRGGPAGSGVSRGSGSPGLAPRAAIAWHLPRGRPHLSLARSPLRRPPPR